MNEGKPIPTAEEIDVHGSLDEASACRNFLGKSLPEAEALFRESSVRYQEDLMWMGPVAFRFYIQAAIHYVESEDGAGDSDIISCLAACFRFWLDWQPAELIPCARLLEDFCRSVVARFDRYDADAVIDIGLKERYRDLAEIFAAMTKSPSEGQ